VAAARRCGEVKGSGRGGDWGGRDAGIGEETCRRLGFLLGWDVFIPHCKKIGWLRFAARKIRRLMCKDRCEAPMGGQLLYL
jgi:hypothetical protein